MTDTVESSEEDHSSAEPTSEQARVIDLPADAQAFVVAGPGSGKTWTLLRRAGNLVARDEISPSDMLVLSFTRAVVRELRRRDEESSKFPSIFPETFDSFATRLLREHAADEAWERASYERRIKAATEFIKNGDAALALDPIRHVLVDEVQDLIGPRADFVAAVLGAVGGGFTAFGDPAQAIYDYDRAAGGVLFLSRLDAGLAKERLELHGNQRATAQLAQEIESVRQALIHPDTADTTAEDAFATIETLGEFDDLPTLVGLMRGTTAVLCRDNATALVLSRSLYDNSVEHRVRRGAVDRPVAGWVGAVLAGSARLGQQQLGERLLELDDVGFPSLPDPAVAWRLLQRLDSQARGQAVRASEIAEKIALGRVPELIDEPTHRLVLSTVHRAKGLEFDTCVVVDWRREPGEHQVQEERVLFVAMSRARRALLHAGERPRKERWFRAHGSGDRLVKHGQKDWQTFGIELRGGDVHAPVPGGAFGIHEDAVEIQQRLTRRVRPGDPVRLAFVGEHDFGEAPLPVYSVIHADGPIGATGEELGRVLASRLGGKAPQAMRGARIDDLETVKGLSSNGDAAGLGSSGLWLRPRLAGLADFDWKGC